METGGNSIECIKKMGFCCVKEYKAMKKHKKCKDKKCKEKKEVL